MDAEKQVTELIAAGLMLAKNMFAVQIFAAIHGAHVNNGFEGEHRVTADYNTSQEIAEKFFLVMAKEISDIREQMNQKEGIDVTNHAR